MGQGKDNGRGKGKKATTTACTLFPSKIIVPIFNAVIGGIGVYMYIYSAILYLLDGFWT